MPRTTIKSGKPKQVEPDAETGGGDPCKAWKSKIMKYINEHLGISVKGGLSTQCGDIETAWQGFLLEDKASCANRNKDISTSFDKLLDKSCPKGSAWLEPEPGPEK